MSTFCNLGRVICIRRPWLCYLGHRYARRHTFAHAHVWVKVQVHGSIYGNRRTHTHIYIYVHAYVSEHMDAHTYAHEHPHKRTRARAPRNTSFSAKDKPEFSEAIYTLFCLRDLSMSALVISRCLHSYFFFFFVFFTYVLSPPSPIYRSLDF